MEHRKERFSRDRCAENMGVGLRFSAPDYSPPEVESAERFRCNLCDRLKLHTDVPPTTCVEVGTQTDWETQEEQSQEERKKASPPRPLARNGTVVTGTHRPARTSKPSRTI